MRLLALLLVALPAGIVGNVEGYTGGRFTPTTVERGIPIAPATASRSARTTCGTSGHAMGFYHSGVPNEVMSGTKGASCGVTLSARERPHMALAYARPVGNRDLDVDPSGGSPTGMRAVVAID